MQVTVINLITGKADIRCLADTSRALEISRRMLKSFQRKKVTIFNNLAISFDTTIHKENKAHHILIINEQRRLQRELKEKENFETQSNVKVT